MSISTGQIGSDESGKGDYFGPLVIAGVYVVSEQEEQLRAVGVKDSKAVTDKKATTLAEQIRAGTMTPVIVSGGHLGRKIHAIRCFIDGDGAPVAGVARV